MKAISIRQPWVFWIHKGWKTIETRSHNRFQKLKGQRIAIQAGKIMDKSAFFHAEPFLTKKQMNETLLYFGMEIIAQDLRPRKNVNPAFGAVTCTAIVKDIQPLEVRHFKDALIQSTRLSALFLEDVEILPEPIPWRGSLNIFHVPDDLLHQSHS